MYESSESPCVPSAGKVVAQVFDASGRRVTDLIDGDLPAGEHRVSWNGRDNAGRSVASGVYFLQLEPARGSRVARFVVIR